MILEIIHTVHAAENGSAASGGVTALLGLDWKLFLAQLINFGIVLLVLWKWVFTPLTKLLQDRTARIEKTIQDSKKLESEMQAFTSWKEKEIMHTRQEAAGIIVEAKKDADSLKHSMVAQTRVEQEELVAKARAQIATERTIAITEIRSQMGDLIIQATEQVIHTKLDEKKDKELIKEIVNTL